MKVPLAQSRFSQKTTQEDTGKKRVTKEEGKTKDPAPKQQPKPLSNHKQTLDVDELPDSVLGQRRHQESATKKQLPTPGFCKASMYISSDDSSGNSDEDADRVKVDSGEVEEIDVNS